MIIPVPNLAPCVPPDLYEFAKEIVIQVRADAMLRDGRLTADQGGPRHGDLLIEEAWHRCEREGRLPNAYPAFAQPDDFAAFTSEVRAELERAQAEWPDGDIYLRLAALSGEVGELAEGTIKNRPALDLRAEAVQVAVTAYRAARVIMRGAS